MFRTLYDQALSIGQHTLEVPPILKAAIASLIPFSTCEKLPRSFEPGVGGDQQSYSKVMRHLCEVSSWETRSSRRAAKPIHIFQSLSRNYRDMDFSAMVAQAARTLEPGWGSLDYCDVNFPKKLFLERTGRTRPPAPRPIQPRLPPPPPTTTDQKQGDSDQDSGRWSSRRPQTDVRGKS